MGSQIVIDPVHRIEGHGKITIQLDASGHVEDAAFHVTQFRGFEKFCEGRPYYEMPSLVERICGICRFRTPWRPPRPATPSSGLPSRRRDKNFGPF